MISLYLHFFLKKRKMSAYADADDRLVFGVVYWYLWTVLLPRLRGYRLEEEKDVQKDGSAVTRMVKVRDE